MVMCVLRYQVPVDDGSPLTVEVDGPVKDERPHSRACGIKNHEHGAECTPDCPTCGGDKAAE